MVNAQSEWNPRRWDPKAEHESESDEEIEVSLSDKATCVSRICPVTVQKLKAQQEHPEGQDPQDAGLFP